MADSGVDTSNEGSDNSVFDISQCGFKFEAPAIPLTQYGEWFTPSATHDYVSKIKRTTNPSRCFLRGILECSKNPKLRFAASVNNVELVEKMLRLGADPNSSDDHKRSPLHLAACRGYIDVVRVLLKHGANPNIKDTLGNTPLHLAACTSHIPVVIELLDAGTDVTAHDKHGRSPIQLAQSKLKLIQIRPAWAGDSEELKQEIRLVLEMMLKYLAIQKANATEMEILQKRLETVSTREEVDNEVQCLLNSLDELKLR